MQRLLDVFHPDYFTFHPERGAILMTLFGLILIGAVIREIRRCNKKIKTSDII